jgi:dTDP-4-amino-4,6-dideoxygalactose transaminase/nucleoside-diphosphate-sugar epimerase
MRWVVLGGAGFIGGALCQWLHRMGEDVVAVDNVSRDAPWPVIQANLLVDRLELPQGRVVLAQGSSNPRALRRWTLAMDNAFSTARIAPQLADRDVTLFSSIEIYGSATERLSETTPPQLPADSDVVGGWVDRAMQAAAEPCPPHRVAGLCRDLAMLDPSGRWVYALSKLAQEQIVQRSVAPDRLTVLRLANVVGPGQFRLIGRLVESALEGRPCTVTDTKRSFVSLPEVVRVAHLANQPGMYNVASGAVALPEVAELVGSELARPLELTVVSAPPDDSCGDVDATRIADQLGGLEDVTEGLRRSIRALAEGSDPMFRPTLSVVVPPRPEFPDVVADRIMAALWSGRVRGAGWSAALTAALAERLRLGEEHRLVLTSSGTNALRLAVRTVAGRPRRGAVAVCPAFTFHATAEVLRQLGWTVRFADVCERTWTLAAGPLGRALEDPNVGVVVAVDTLGAPCDYAVLSELCGRAGVALVADSAPSLGSLYAREPVGTQAAAHAFSLSFAKVVSGGGSGGAVVLPAAADLGSSENWLRSSAITEISAVAALDGVDAMDDLIQRRSAVADIYRDALSGMPEFAFQEVRVGDRHSWVHWVTLVDESLDRERLGLSLAADGVQTKAYYEPLDGLDLELSPVTASLHRRTLALPMSSELSPDDAERVMVSTVRARRELLQADADVRDPQGESPPPSYAIS